MTVLVVGPSSVGKSTFLRSQRALELGLAGRPVIFGFEVLKRDIPAGAIVHYNMLYQTGLDRRDSSGPNEWSLQNEPVFSKIIDTCPEQCIVLVTPLRILKERMRAGQIVEDSLGPDVRYDNDLWLDAVEWLDLFRIYEELFETL